MKKIALLLCLLLPLVAIGCDDDGEDTTTDTVMTDTSTGGDTTETTGDTDDDAMTSEGACNNAEDLPIVGGDPDPADVASDCALVQGCLNDPDTRGCTVTCMQMTVELSDGCAGCYADSVVCAAQNCLEECIGGADSAPCVECRETEGCTPEFFECSGLTPQ